MDFNFHNKLELNINGKKYEYFNTMLNSIFNKLKNLEPYGQYIAIGTGTNQNPATSTYLDDFALSISLSNEVMQSDLKLGSVFVKKIAKLQGNLLANTYITEIGLCDSQSNNPIIYNYFNLVSENEPNGILIDGEDEVLISVYIYLSIPDNSKQYLTGGKNRFLEFMLGDGLSESVYAVRGTNYSSNLTIYREDPRFENSYLCSLTFNVDDENNDLTLEFSADMESGETSEIVFIYSGKPFARLNTLLYHSTSAESLSKISKRNYTIDLGKDIYSIDSITNLQTNTVETDFFASLYASDLGDRILFDELNIFDADTPRFVSKDGDKIFFVYDDNIYGYKNIGLQLTKIATGITNVSYISKIISFDDSVFVVSKVEPYIHTYKLINNELVEVTNDFEDYTNYNELANEQGIDITIANNDTYMLGFIDSNKAGNTIYFEFDSDNNCFSITQSQSNSTYEFSYVVAMYKTIYSDACVMYLKGGELSINCRLVTHYPDGTDQDIYTVLAYYLTHDTSELYSINRGIIVEKTTSPRLKIYFYPQLYEYELSILSNEIDDFLSPNLNYLIQKTSSNTYKIYNLVGYDDPEEFTNGFPSQIEQSNIVDFEFLNNVLLIFLSNSTNKIIAYNLNLDKTKVDNVSGYNTNYEIQANKINKLGKNNEGVIAKFITKIDL